MTLKSTTWLQSRNSTRNFDAGDDDRGLPNDVVPFLDVRDTRPGREDTDRRANVPVCTYNRTEALYLHDLARQFKSSDPAIAALGRRMRELDEH